MGLDNSQEMRGLILSLPTLTYSDLRNRQKGEQGKRGDLVSFLSFPYSWQNKISSVYGVRED